MFQKEQITLLKQFVLACKSNPQFLNENELSFFREWLQSLGAKIPPPVEKESTEEPSAEPKVEETPDSKPDTKDPEPEPAQEEQESEEEPESDLDLEELDGIIKDEEDLVLEMGDESTEVTDEMLELSNQKRSEAMSLKSSGDLDGCLKAFTEAIKNNPLSASLYSKRAQILIMMSKPKAAIKDCDKAISINKDTAPPYKWRGRAYRKLGDYLQAYQNFQSSNKLDYDDSVHDWLKEVTPNAKKILDHNRKY